MTPHGRHSAVSGDTRSQEELRAPWPRKQRKTSPSKARNASSLLTTNRNREGDRKTETDREREREREKRPSEMKTPEIPGMFRYIYICFIACKYTFI